MTASVLVVDDKEQNIKLLESRLRKEYYTVFTANSGPKALDMLSQNKIDIILLDVMMPGMDGFETCQAIKANPETSHIPVIIVTALNDNDSKIKGLEVGADEFLTKPIDDIPLFPRVKSLARMKLLIDELRLRNRTNQVLGISTVEVTDNFLNSNILFINDDIVQVKHTKNILTKITNNIKIITDPNEMINIGHYVPDLVIISSQLEHADPLLIAITLMSKENCKYSIFMLMMEDENLTIATKAIELGINDYFLSSAVGEEVLARVKTQLRRKKYQDNLRNSLDQSVNLSIKDGLTNVFNRRYLDIHIKQMMLNTEENNSFLSVIMIDIDHFKDVNDTYGHQEGDIILKNFTLIIQDTLRVTDLIARYGGEEFIVLLGDTALDGAEIIAERIKENIKNAEFKVLDGTVIIKKTASMGITEYYYGESVETLFERVDSALYQAKNSGRDKIIKKAKLT